jgi:hypothetical protein
MGAAEQRRRGRKLSMSDSPRKGRVESVAVPLTQGKVNAVRAAYKAGITPSRIARQFGISQSDVCGRRWRLISQIGESKCRSCIDGAPGSTKPSVSVTCNGATAVRNASSIRQRRQRIVQIALFRHGSIVDLLNRPPQLFLSGRSNAVHRK